MVWTGQGEELIRRGLALAVTPAREGDVVEVAEGRPARQSSVYERWGDAGQALVGEPGGRFAFHTEVEDRPWWEVDLQETVPVRRIVVWNREDEGLACAERAIPLRVLLADGSDGPWREIARIAHVFGGARSDRPLVLDLADPVRARRLRLQVDRRSTLHLDHVRVFAGAPGLPFARAVALRRDGPEAWSAELMLRHDSGFHSICTTALASVVDLHRSGIRTDWIDGSAVFQDFRDPGDAGDVYRRLFAPDLAAPLPAVGPIEFSATHHHHSRYRDLDMASLRPFVQRYFMPSDTVLERQAMLLQRLGIDPSTLVGLYYRGTDKHTEVAPTDIGEYIALAECLLASDPALRVLVQTDQAQIRDAVVAHFGARCVFFDEMPVTAGDMVMHKLDLSQEHGITKGEFARTLLASIAVLSRCRYLITHTGNGGLWLALYRGRADGLYQFDSSHVLVPPPS